MTRKRKLSRGNGGKLFLDSSDGSQDLLLLYSKQFRCMNFDRVRDFFGCVEEHRGINQKSALSAVLIPARQPEKNIWMQPLYNFHFDESL